MTDFERLARDLEQALLALDRMSAKKALEAALTAAEPFEIVDQVVTPALQRIGQGWEQGRVALSQIYMAGRICEEQVAATLPVPRAGAAARQPTMAIAVLEDHHNLGSRVVQSLLRASGFEVLDYGHGVSVGALAERVIADGVRILLVSTLMLPAALRVKDLTARLSTVGDRVFVVVGGAPFRFDSQLWQEVGADRMGKNATEAIAIVSELVSICQFT